MPKATKTGTTIAGIIFKVTNKKILSNCDFKTDFFFELKDGVILGADTRATSGSVVADKNCSKIHYIADNMYCCGAGTAADTENATGFFLIDLFILLEDLNSNSKTLLNRVN